MNDQAASFSPYPGLRAFESHEAHLFFGREQQSDELLRRLQTHRFLAVVGTSGCGKSSLVKAGLLPSLHGGFMVTAGSVWRVASMRPGEAPLAALARALNAPGVLGSHDAQDGAPLAPTDFTEVSLRRGPLGLVDAARALWPSPEVNLLVLVDQFEETIRATLQGRGAQADEATAFVKLLLEAAHQTELPIHIVLTMRSDYLGLCSRFRGLPEAINEGEYLVPRLTRDQLRSAIVGPAAVAGATVTRPLVQKLLEEIADDQDRLPVLQHALMRTWALKSSGDTIDLADYSKTGGLASALSNHANEIYDGLDARSRDIARLLFQRLTEGGEPGQETRRWARIGEICDVAGASKEQVIAVVEAFRAPGCSFLMPPSSVPLTVETTLDISHESLIRQWNRLKTWTDEERKSAEQYQRLSAAAELHAQGRLSPWRRPELDIGLKWQKEQHPTPAWAQRYAGDFSRAMAFLEKSRRARVLSVSAAVAVAAVLAVAGFKFFGVLADARLRTLDDRFVAAGQVVDPLTRALLLAELGSGRNSADRAGVHRRLFVNVATTPIPHAVLGRNSEYGVIGIDFSPDNRITLADSGGRLHWWSADGRGGPKTWNLRDGLGRDANGEAPRRLAAVSFSGDTAWVAAAYENRLLWGRTNGADMGDVPVPAVLAGAVPTSMALNHTGTRLAVGFSTYQVGIWVRRADGSTAFERLYSQESPIAALDIDRQDSRLATASWDGALRVWDLATGERVVEIDPVQAQGQSPTANSVRYSPDGRWIMSGYGDGTARVWSSDGLGHPLVLQAHTGAVTSASFAPAAGDGRGDGDGTLVVATTSADRTARIWTIRRDPAGLHLTGPPTVLAGHASAVNIAVFSPDGRQLATASSDGVTFVWWTESQEPRLLGRHGDVIESVSFSSSGARLVTASRDRTARVWDVNGSTPPLRLDHADWVRSAVFNPGDDFQVATGSFDQRLGIWDLRTRQPRFLDLKAPGEAAPDRSIMAVSWRRDGSWLAAASIDATARLWPLRPGSAPRDVISLDHRADAHPGHENEWVLDIDYAPDGARVVTASADGWARLWNERGELVRCFLVHPHTHPPIQGDDPRVVKAVFNPSGDRFATASGDVVQVWPVDGEKAVWEMGHRAAVNDVSFVAVDGGWLITASDDGTARVSDAQAGREIVSLNNSVKVTAAAADPAGRYVVTGGSDGAVRLWRIDTPDLVSYLRNVTTACLAPADRVNLLGEDESQAQRAYESCERRNGRATVARRGDALTRAR